MRAFVCTHKALRVTVGDSGGGGEGGGPKWILAGLEAGETTTLPMVHACG